VLVARLQDAAGRLISVVEAIEDHWWDLVPEPGVWSLGKEVEHVAEAAVYHQWIVQLTIGEKLSSRRPAIERVKLTSDLSPPEAVTLVRQRTDEGVQLLASLTDEQLDLVTTPPRAPGQRLAETIERVLIGHYDAHHGHIATKLQAARSTPP
jgi:uncharacterized damage-inducible protein DinB